MNDVKLTDDELALIATSLIAIIVSYEKQVERNGKDSLDCENIKSIEAMKLLYEKLDTEYF